jgi:hypothetical protein
MAKRQGNFGLSVEGSTALGRARGEAFEESLGEFSSYLKTSHEDEFLLTPQLKDLSRPLRQGLRQFFALNSSELLSERPPHPKIGALYRESESLPIQVFDGTRWKPAREGIAPDLILICRKTQRLVLIEAKSGDTRGNAHIERAGARATPSFLQALEKVFKGRARYLYVFGGPMVTAKEDLDLGPLLNQRGTQKGKVAQTPEQRRLASAKYHRQIEVLFGDGTHPVPWNTILWDGDGMKKLIDLFESELADWLRSP